MSTKAVHENSNEKVTLSQKINDFLVKFKVVLIVFFVILVVALVTLITVNIVTEKRNKVAFEKIETLVADLETARAAEDKSGLMAKEDEISASLLVVAKSNKNSFAGARAYMSAADIFFTRKDWKNALENYTAAVKAAPESYVAGMCYYNAGICSDELGNADDAVNYLTKAVDNGNFPLKPRALFSIGRIEEQRSKKEAAIAAYEKMAEKYPDDEWTLLAKSRIIALQIK